LALYSTETVTIVTAATIGLILAVYLIVLKKNGWLGGGAKFYRCPNRRCNRIFQQPVELKDLSETPPRTYRACPHCGVDLEALLTSSTKRKLRPKGTVSPQQKNTEVEIGDSSLNIGTGKPEVAPRIEGSGKKSSVPVEIQKSQTITENRKKPWKVNGATVANKSASESKQESDPLFKTPPKSDMPQKTLEEDASNTEAEFSNAPEGCTHFFGYLRCLPKGSAVPYGCYSCRRMVDCYMH
jgi:hypothetical protein